MKGTRTGITRREAMKMMAGAIPAFGASNHSAHSRHWFQTAYGYDGEGPQAGVRYDAYTLTKEDGKGRWWEGMDPVDVDALVVRQTTKDITHTSQSTD
jgi:alpha-L-fucosidase